MAQEKSFNMSTTKEYFAFISYKREDEKWAKWLQQMLEHYRLPVNVRKENTALPQTIRPIFKDTSELAAGVLAEEIHNALENSKFIIVICSPRAAQSEWVGKEVQTFIDMGRSDKIIPFIIGGTPFSKDSEEECFPSALLKLPKEQELLGVNINEMGRNAAVVKVVAHMFGLKFDTLWQRYEREQKRRRWMLMGGVLLFALVSLAVGGWFVRQNGIIKDQKEQLQSQTVRLIEDSIIMANHIRRIQTQNDSITQQNTLILQQRKDLNRTNQQIQLSNQQLTEERDNVLRANWGLKLSNTKISSEHALSLLHEGNLIDARNLLKEICSDKDASRLICLPEVENSMRKIYREMTREGIRTRFTIDNVGEISFAQFDSTGDSLYLFINDTCMVKYNVDKGILLGIMGTIPDYNTSNISIEDYDNKTGHVFYTIDSTAYVKSIYSQMDIFEPIRFDDDISDFIVSPKHDSFLCELIYREKSDFHSEWHFCYPIGTKMKNIILSQCDNVYCYSPDGKRILADIDDMYCIYNLHEQKTEKIIPSDFYASKAHFTSDGTNIIFQIEAEDTINNREKISQINVFNIASNEFVEWGEHITGPQHAYITENPAQNRFFVGDYYGNLSVYKTDWLPYRNFIKGVRSVACEKAETLFGHSERISSIIFNAEGNRMASVSNGKICVWDINVKDAIQAIRETQDFIASSGKIYLKETNRLAQLYDAATHQPIGIPLYRQPDGFNHRQEIRNISRNNEIVITTQDSLICIINTRDQTWFSIPFNCYNYLLKTSLDFNGTRLLVCDDHNGSKNDDACLSVYDIRNRKILAQSGKYHCSAIALSPDGSEVVLSTGNQIYLLDSKTLKEKRKLVNAHAGFIVSINYSPNGKYIASAAWDRTVCLWDAQTGNMLKQFLGAERELWSCCISADCKYLIASTLEDEHLKIKNYIWNIDTGQIVEIIENDDNYYFCQDVPSMLFTQKARIGSGFLNFPPLTELKKYFSDKK